jgi:hypothetical protein
MTLVAPALRYSTAEELEQPGFDPLKANDSSFDFAQRMGHTEPHGTYGPITIASAREGQNEIDAVNNINWETPLLYRWLRRPHHHGRR